MSKKRGINSSLFCFGYGTETWVVQKRNFKILKFV
ncbi:hypothetical protein SRABI04_02610 [Chryseobacterium sp. Bi04]|nr:hypothetical protein SRABI04_02610 [Chryseobacterium sp. Bi04]